MGFERLQLLNDEHTINLCELKHNNRKRNGTDKSDKNATTKNDRKRNSRMYGSKGDLRNLLFFSSFLGSDGITGVGEHVIATISCKVVSFNFKEKVLLLG